METPPTGPEGPQSPMPGSPPAQPPTYGDQVPPGGWQAAPPPGQQGYATPFADWWPRVGAWLIDWLIVAVPTAIVFFVLIAGAVGITGDNETAGIGAAIGAILLSGLVFVILGTLYFALTMKREGQNNGQTFGKQLVGIRVVRASGEPMDFGWSALRDPAVQFAGFYFIGSTFLFGLPWLVDVLWPLWDDQNRALHDIICDTRVVQA